MIQEEMMIYNYSLMIIRHNIIIQPAVIRYDEFLQILLRYLLNLCVQTRQRAAQTVHLQINDARKMLQIPQLSE